MAKAKRQVEALNLRGRGRKRFDDVETLRQAVNEIVQRHRVEELLWLRYDQHTTTRSVRAYKDRPAYVKQERQATAEVQVGEEALESAVRWLGWRVTSTNQPAQQLSLEQAVLAYPTGVHIWWREVWADSRVARCRYGRCMCSAMTMPPS